MFINTHIVAAIYRFSYLCLVKGEFLFIGQIILPSNYTHFAIRLWVSHCNNTIRINQLAIITIYRLAMLPYCMREQIHGRFLRLLRIGCHRYQQAYHYNNNTFYVHSYRFRGL